MAAKKANELYITRVFDAPVKVVWEAWVDPEKVGKWWGPRGFTITTKSKNVKVGGTWDYIMHGPDGVDYPNITTFLEVEKYSRLVYDHGANEHQPPLFRVTVVFQDLGGKTQMNMTMALATAEAARETKKFVKKAGGDSTWDRLAEYLSPNDKFIINRVFEAPQERVFDMWVNPQHIPQWLPPTGFKMEWIDATVKAGETSFYSMSNGEMTMYGQSTYQEISKPHRIVYTQNFCDEKGKLSKHPGAPTWPDTMLVVVSFTAEDDNSTRVTLTTEVQGTASEAEIETFHGAKSGMTQGWTGSFDRLEEILG